MSPPSSGPPHSNQWMYSIGISDQDDSLFPSLTIKQRVIGWACCFTAGTLITIGSFGSFTLLLLGRPTRFALAYTLGNVLQLVSTMFLVGPLRQVKCMFRNNRVIAAGIYVLALFTTLYTCIHSPHHRALILLAVIIQFLALFWYALSYIPYGRQMTTSVTSHLTQRLLAD
ncbi:Vesicle transport protein SFT2B, putative [Perkinsus marinus ATCC 50983]|uniref:Vesicle transport protein n=1 Tax=Perkinsus marinus (strain ATCC 50983 / TXsc) TaxID=423536 RepID=C5LE94_PERM5|nr:Vesicle transport protein SFT2B, putative [Perkinsus marinus ATCC 50983]EER04962.1 Vesicle transport protein SFT2B, putative [Perkinsus marinus ATCC 50983]|eukprot:XP_002773146.1 Vesicle transport protein SFT2B, putative [Perkinsus marinus ATCC 50983]